MNILVTGATGFIGKNLIKSLQSNHQIHLLIRPSSDYTSLSVKKTFIFKDNIEELADYLKVEKIDGIVHLASLYVTEHMSCQIKDMILSNIYFGVALLEACKIAKIKWFLNTGSIWQNYNSADLSDDYCPANLYAASKQAFIDMANFYTMVTDLRFCTLKLCDTYGPGDTRNKIFAIFEKIAKSGEQLDMSLGYQRLDILHIDDVVSGFIHLINMLQDDSCFLRSEYVLSSGKHYSLRELARIFEEKYQVKLNIKWGGRPYRQREIMIPYKGNVLVNWKPVNKLKK